MASDKKYFLIEVGTLNKMITKIAERPFLEVEGLINEIRLNIKEAKKEQVEVPKPEIKEVKEE